MSIQLTLYPQQNEGVYTFDQYISYTNLLADPGFTSSNNFSSLVQTVQTTNPRVEALNDFNPTSNWAGFKTDGTTLANVTAPSITNGILSLNTAGDGISGCYQLAQNLIPGASYVIYVYTIQQAAGTFTIGIPSEPFTFTLNNGVTVNQTDIFTNTNASFGLGFVQYSVQFTATATEHTIMFSLQGDGSTSQSTKIAHTQLIQATPIITNVDDGQVNVDLYDHSPIPMTLSIDDFKKIAEKPQSFSKAFNLPATKHNNKIFTNIFDVTTSAHQNAHTFNPYLTTRAALKEDGNIIFEGHLRLIDIKKKNDEITYNVNLFSTAVSLKTALGNKTFNDFDGGATGGGPGLSELEHNWTKVEIKNSWIGQLPISNAVTTGYTGFLTTRLADAVAGDTETNVLKYPFVQWNGDISQEQGGSQHGFPELNHMCNAFRPWIKVKYLVDRIIHEAGFTYQSDFMEGTGNYANPQGLPANVAKNPDFLRLYMDFNWGSKVTPGNFGSTIEASYVPNDAAAVNRANPVNTWVNLEFTAGTQGLEQFGWNNTDSEFVVPSDNLRYTIEYEVKVTNNNNGSVADRWHIALLRYDASNNFIQYESFDYGITPGSVSTVTTTTNSATFAANAGEKIRLAFNKQQPNASSQGGAPNDVRQGDHNNTSDVGTIMNVTVVPGTMTSDILLYKRGNIKQWEFLKDLFTMFNLIVLQDKADPTKLKIDPYDDIFIDNTNTTGITQRTHDFTEKVDVSEMEFTPIKLKKNVFWEFKEDNKDYATTVYIDATGDKFGNMEVTTNASIPSGEQKIKLKVFSPTLCKPLFNGFTNKLYVPVIINQKSDGSIQGFDNKPRILYDISGDHSNFNNLTALPNPKTYRMPSFNGVTGEQRDNFCQFGHVTAYPTSAQQRDFNFGSVQMIEYGGTPRNLYQEYWNPYYDELYHSDTMTVKIRCVLTPQEMSIINFYDKIFIKNREYRLNKIDYKAGELSTIELIRIP